MEFTIGKGAIRSASQAPWKGAGSLAGGEQSEPPEYCNKRNAPRQGRWEVLQPLPGCVSLFLFYPGVRFAHPWLISFRPIGAEYVTVFMKRDSHF